MAVSKYYCQAFEWIGLSESAWLKVCFKDMRSITTMIPIVSNPESSRGNEMFQEL